MPEPRGDNTNGLEGAYSRRNSPGASDRYLYCHSSDDSIIISAMILPSSNVRQLL